LVAGVLLRPEKSAAPIPSESDLLQLQLSAQRRDFDRRGLFLRTKARELTRFVADARARTSTLPHRAPKPGETIVLIGPQDAWAGAVTAGTFQTACGETNIEEIGSTATIPANLENAVAFDLDNSLAGYVISCGDRRLLTTPEGFNAWTAQRAVENKLLSHGLRLATAGTELEVLEVGPDSPLRRVGLREGDRILEPATKAEVPEATELVIRRGQRTRTLKVAPK
jgi:hypothetical protein